VFSFLSLRLLAAAVAISPSPSPSPSLPPQITRVVTSDRSDETLRNAVRTTYVVTASEIARNGYRTVGDALANVPGVEIESYGPIGSNVDYGIRGSSSAQVLVLVDGRPAAGSLANSVQLGTMSTTGVSRIEIVEGGGSTLYGQGSIGGIINVITSGEKTPASAMLRYGSFDDRELQVAADGFSFERVVAQNAYALPDAGSGFPATRNDSDYEATTARYGTGGHLGAIGVTLRTSLESDNTGTIGFFPYYDPSAREQDVNGDGVLGFSLRRAQSQASLTLDGDRQQIEYEGALSTESRDGVSLRNIVGGSQSRLIYGVDLSRGTVRSDDGAGDIAFDPLVQTAAYAQQTWTGARDEFYAGIRGERDGVLGGEFSPSAGARFDLSGAYSLKLNAATAFRAPNASELFFPGYGSVAQGFGYLQPERAKVGDVTLVDARFLGGASVGWFVNDTRDLIVATCVSGCSGATPDYAPQNVDHAHMAGFTFETQTVPVHGISATLHATDLYLAQDLDAQTRLPNDPVFDVDLGLQYAGGPRAMLAAAGVSERAVGARGFDTSVPAFDQPSAYDDLRAYVSFRVRPALLLTLRGYNLGNERYAQVEGYPMPGRTFAVELRSH
jgi:vitamin B12 transporter